MIARSNAAIMGEGRPSQRAAAQTFAGACAAGDPQVLRDAADDLEHFANDRRLG